MSNQWCNILFYHDIQYFIVAYNIISYDTISQCILYHWYNIVLCISVFINIVSWNIVPVWNLHIIWYNIVIVSHTKLYNV